jgi:hypothetical protein
MMSESNLPVAPIIACTLTQTELATRRNELLPGFLSRADSRETIDGGFRWSFIDATGLLNDVASVIEAERCCCQFLRLRLTLEPDGGPLRMEVTGPEGAQELLRSFLLNAPSSLPTTS